MNCPVVHIVIVSYNGKHNLEYSLPTLVAQDYPNFKVFVADNNSTDGTKEWLIENFPGVYLIKQTKNIGMAAMNDILTWPKENGIEEYADYIFVAGWDLKYDKRCVRYAVDTMEQKKDIGLIGYEILGLFEWVDPSELEVKSAEFTELTIKDTVWVPGACSFYRRSLLDKIGFLDPAYFAYAEEDDIQFRIRKSGFRTVLINVPTWQNVRESSIPKFKASYLSIRNNIRYSLKNFNDLFGIKVAFALLNTACNPFITIDKSNRVNQRRRPFNIFKNFYIIVKAFSWNLFNYIETRNSRKETKKRIEQGKKLYQNLNFHNEL